MLQTDIALKRYLSNYDSS